MKRTGHFYPFLFFFLLSLIGLRGQETLPALVEPITDLEIAAAGDPVAIDLKSHFAIPGVAGKIAQFNSNLGIINVELFEEATPLTVANFLSYVNDGDYVNTFIHRSVSGFIIQGGGFTNTFDDTDLVASVVAKPPVKNEFGISNTRGTIAMAKLGGDPDSATSEWFFNLADNSANLDNQNGGFTVFGRAIGTGLEVIDAIAAVPVFNAGGTFTSLPLINFDNVLIVGENLVTFSSIREAPIFPDGTGGPSVLEFSLTNSNPDLLTAELSGSDLNIVSRGAPSGEGEITIRATDAQGNFAEDAFTVSVKGSDPFEGVPLGEGFFFSPWYGIYNTNFYPWIFHIEHGWQFVFETETNGAVFVFDLESKDFWFTQASFRLSNGLTFFSFARGTFNFYFVGSGDASDANKPRQFVDLETEEFFSIPIF